MQVAISYNFYMAMTKAPMTKAPAHFNMPMIDRSLWKQGETVWLFAVSTVINCDVHGSEHFTDRNIPHRLVFKLLWIQFDSSLYWSGELDQLSQFLKACGLASMTYNSWRLPNSPWNVMAWTAFLSFTRTRSTVYIATCRFKWLVLP